MVQGGKMPDWRDITTCLQEFSRSNSQLATTCCCWEEPNIIQPGAGVLHHGNKKNRQPHILNVFFKLHFGPITCLVNKRLTETYMEISLMSFSNWLDTFSKCSAKTVPFIHWRSGANWCNPLSPDFNSGQHSYRDKIKFIMDVLFPEVGLVLAVLCMVSDSHCF